VKPLERREKRKERKGRGKGKGLAGTSFCALRTQSIPRRFASDI